MPKPSQSGKKRFFYNQSLKRDKSHQKYKNLTNHTITLIKRLEKEGMTKWIANALNKAQAKIKSYGITLAQMTSALAHKELSSLEKTLSSHLVFVQKKGHNVSISTKRDVIAKTSNIILSDAPVAKKAPAKKVVVEKKETPTKKEVIKKAPVEKKVAVKKAAPKKEATEKKPTTKKSA
jgi:hypothetical protein